MQIYFYFFSYLNEAIINLNISDTITREHAPVNIIIFSYCSHYLIKAYIFFSPFLIENSA